MLGILKRAVWAVAPNIAYSVRERREKARAARPDQRAPAEIFGDIYRDAVWGGRPGEFNSGLGSDDDVSADFVSVVRDYIKTNSLTSIVDLGCGDFRVGSRLLQPGLAYTGVDVVPALVESHQRQHARPGVEFTVADIIDGELPAGDLYLVRQVLQHLSNEQISRVLEKLAAKARVIIAEHHPAPDRFKLPNRDKPAGHGIRVPFGSGVYPDQRPFSFPCRVIATTRVPPIIAPGEVITIYAKA
ncbi:MAG: hypothetical protein JWO72_1271 [Caulobacteraceae bacterium]|nr:hypothetical protein [Caulobacteraceae bacterium]